MCKRAIHSLPFFLIGLLFLSQTIMAQIAPNAGRLYVKEGSTGTGQSWANAANLTEALKYARTNEGAVTEIWVAGGTYVPESNEGLNASSGSSLGDRDKTFLVSKVALYGGFSGEDDNETVATRKWKTVNGQKEFIYPTILSGDIGDEDKFSDNCFHVVVALGELDGTEARIDGFVITGGNTYGSDGSTIMMGLVEVERSYGGGIFAYGNVTLTNNTLYGNEAQNLGGGIYASYNITLTSNKLYENWAGVNGGGIFASNNTILTGNTLYENTSPQGGGVYARNNVTLVNNALFENEAEDWQGGGVYANSNVTMINNTLSRNKADVSGSGVFARQNVNLINNILWDNTDSNLEVSNASTIIVSYNLIGDENLPDNITNNGNNKVGTGIDPLFADPATGNYSLLKGSPAIDAGSNDGYSGVEGTDIDTDLDAAGNKRLQGAAINMGAFESIFQVTPPPTPVYHTITLEVAPGIQLYAMSPGKLTVEEGDVFFLQFIPEDPAVKAADVLFLVDGVETAFKDLGGNYYFSYILNPVNDDHTILIALREYPVTLPDVKGITLDPAPGIHQVAYGSPFSFTLTLSEEVKEGSVRVYINGNEWAPEDYDNDVEIVQTLPLRYTIDKVTGPADVEIEVEYNPVGNAIITDNDIYIAAENGQLKIENSGQATRLSVYTLAGQLYTTRQIPAGTTRFTLPEGIYIVQAGGITQKIFLSSASR